MTDTLYICSECGHVDHANQGAGGFVEQGTDREGNFLLDCGMCNAEPHVMRKASPEQIEWAITTTKSRKRKAMLRESLHV